MIWKRILLIWSDKTKWDYNGAPFKVIVKFQSKIENLNI